MKKTMCMLLALLMILSLTACGQKKQEEPAEEGFRPALDTSTSSHISIAGSYNNFEALEAEFDRFNEYYPNVELMFTKVDDYNNMIGTVLDGNDAPDIYVNYSWMYGREKYKAAIDHAENLADPALGLDLDCIRSNIILRTDDGTFPMVPVFSNTYGMLVNNSLFEKEGLSVPTTYSELVAVCNAFREKGYENPMKRSLRSLRWPCIRSSAEPWPMMRRLSKSSMPLMPPPVNICAPPLKRSRSF